MYAQRANFHDPYDYSYPQVDIEGLKSVLKQSRERLFAEMDAKYRRATAGPSGILKSRLKKYDPLVPQYVMNEVPKGNKGKGLFGGASRRKRQIADISPEDRKWAQLPNGEITANYGSLLDKYNTKARKAGEKPRFGNKTEIEEVVGGASQPDIVMPGSEPKTVLLTRGYDPGMKNDAMVIEVRPPKPPYVKSVMKMDDEQVLWNIIKLELDGREVENSLQTQTKEVA